MADTSLKTQLVIETKAEGNENLARVQEALRELGVTVKDDGEQIAALAKEVDALAQYVDSLGKLEIIGKQSAAIEEVRRLSDEVVETTVDLDRLREKFAAADETLKKLKQDLAGAAQGSEEFKRLEGEVQGAKEKFDALAASVDKTEQELRQQQGELKDAERAMRAAGVASGDWEQAQKDLNAELQNVYKTVREIDKAAQIDADRGLLGVRAHRDVQREIDATKAAYERLKASGELTWKEQAQAAMKLEERVRELKASTNGWAESLGKAKVALAGAAAGFGGIGVAVKHAIDFESAMADVAKVVDGTDEQMAGLAKRIKEMSGEMPIAAGGLAQMAAAGGQMGVPIENLETFVQLAAKMGTAFGMSAEQAGDAVAKLSNVFGIPIEQVENLGDAINVLGNTMAAKETDIVEVLKRIGGSAKQFGLTAEQAAALGASMLALGVRAEVAGTGINAILTKLQTASMQGKEFQAALQSMGVSAKKLAADIQANPQQALEQFLKTLSRLEGSARAETLTKLFGIEYQDDVARLIGSLETYEGALDRIGDSAKTAGAMQEEFAKKNETTKAKLERLRNVVDAVVINLGEAFLPVLKAIVSVTGDAAGAINSLASAFPNLTAATASIVAFGASWGALKTVVLAGKTALAGAAQTLPALIAGTAAAAKSLYGLAAATKAVALGAAGIGGPFTLAAAAVTFAIVRISDAYRDLKERQREQQKLQESLAETSERWRKRFEDISKSTGVTVRSMEELDKAVADGRLVFDQATATWLSAAQAQEKMARSAATSADSVKTLGEKARQSAGDIMAAFQQAAEGGKKLEEALKELPKALDMKAGAEGVAAFALALDELQKKSEYLGDSVKLTAAQVSEAWKQAVEGMNAGNIGVLIENLKEAERQGALTAEQLAAAFDGIAGAALERLGANAAQALGTVSTEARKAIDDLDAVINTISLAGIEGEKAGRAIEQAFAAAIPKADSLAAIKELEQRLLAAKDAGQITEKAFRAMTDALDGMKQAADPVNKLESALKSLGVNMAKVWGGITSGAGDAIKSVKEVVAAVQESGETGKKAGETIAAAFKAAIPKADTQEALAALRQELRAAGEAGSLTAGQMNELTAALEQQEAALRADGEAAASTATYIENMTRIAEEAKAALSDAGGGEGWARASAAARDYADAAGEAGDASAEAAEAAENAGHVSHGTWWDATIAASDYAEAASEAALRVTGLAGKVALGAAAINNMNNKLREAAHNYIATMEGFDRQMQQIASAQSGAARGVEDLQMRLLQLNGSEEEIAQARAAREKLQLEREIKMLEIQKSRAAYQGDSAAAEQIGEEIKLMREQQRLLAQIHKEEEKQRKEAAREKERQEKEAKRKEREEAKKAAEQAEGGGGDADAGGTSRSAGGSNSPQTKNSTINLGGITINGGGISDPAKFAKLLEPELKKLQRLSA